MKVKPTHTHTHTHTLKHSLFVKETVGQLYKSEAHTSTHTHVRALLLPYRPWRATWTRAFTRLRPSLLLAVDLLLFLGEARELGGNEGLEGPGLLPFCSINDAEFFL